MANLEALISKISFEIVNEGILDENEINKLLGVLANDGVYAMWVYALDKLGLSFKENEEEQRKEKIFALLGKIAELDEYLTNSLNYESLVKEITELTKEIKKLKQEQRNAKKEEKNNLEKKIKEKEQRRKQEIGKINNYFISISNDIQKLLFLKQLLEKTLIYARYHARVSGE